jgi:hypothetical protein
MFKSVFFPTPHQGHNRFTLISNTFAVKLHRNSASPLWNISLNAQKRHYNKRDIETQMSL